MSKQDKVNLISFLEKVLTNDIYKKTYWDWEIDEQEMELIELQPGVEIELKELIERLKGETSDKHKTSDKLNDY